MFIPDDKVSLLESQEEYRMLVEAINSKLSDLGLDYIDFNRIRDLSKKFSLVYEEKVRTEYVYCSDDGSGC